MNATSALSKDAMQVPPVPLAATKEETVANIRTSIANLSAGVGTHDDFVRVKSALMFCELALSKNPALGYGDALSDIRAAMNSILDRLCLDANNVYQLWRSPYVTYKEMGELHKLMLLLRNQFMGKPSFDPLGTVEMIPPWLSGKQLLTDCQLY